jgi:RNA polymerase sigma-70 factor (ECF subfamily)
MFRDETTGKQLNEPEIIRKAQHGDKDAFCHLVLAYRVAVINIVYRMCANVQVSEDAAQIAFLRVWQHLAEYRHQTSFRAWLFRIAINAALDILRREKPVIALDQIEVSTGNSVDDDVVIKQQQEMIEKAMMKLPEASRIVLVLREFQQLSYQEIADALEIPIGTVMSRLNYARKNLLHALQPLQEEI